MSGLIDIWTSEANKMRTNKGQGQQLLRIGVVVDYLVAEHVMVVVVARQHPVKCLEYLELVKMNLLVSVQSLQLL
ncbi:hypothetical protein Tco_1160573 [Tanacetum coccineum]